MPARADPFPRMLPGVVVVLFAMLAVDVESPVRAESACIEQPGALVEGTRWILDHDRAKGRECWILVDAFGHETGLWGGPVTMPQAQPSAVPAPSSQHAPLPGTDVATKRSATQIAHPPHKPPGNVANANRADDGIRADQMSNGKAHLVKPVSSVLISREESTDFEEFLRWRERRQQFEDFFRWRERQQPAGAMKRRASSQ